MDKPIPKIRTIEYYDLFEFCEFFGRAAGSGDRLSDGGRFLECVRGYESFGNDRYIDFYHDAKMVDLDEADPDTAAMQRIALAMGWAKPEDEYWEVSIAFNVCW